MPRRSCFSQKTGRLAKTRSPIGPFSTQKPFLARSAPIFNFPGRPGHLQQRRRAQRASQLTYVAKRGGAQMGTHPLSARVRVATAERISTRVLRLFILGSRTAKNRGKNAWSREKTQRVEARGAHPRCANISTNVRNLKLVVSDGGEIG